MGQFKNLVIGKFWLKVVVIFWWSVVIGTYMWFFSYLGETGENKVILKWVGVVLSTIVGGAGFSHLYSLYKIKIENYSLGFLKPVIFMSLGAIGIIFSIIINHYVETSNIIGQAIAALYGVVGIILLIGFSDSAQET